MPGIYIHIPFCKQACHYCNFHFSVSQKHKSEFLVALKKEMAMQRHFFEVSGETSTLDSLYIGGGTPSILSTEEIQDIFTELFQHFNISSNAEITLEANPDDLTSEKLISLRQTPINRLSIGIQSFRSSDLHYMNRAHNPQQALQALQHAKNAGFENITADLIYGTPGMSDDQWKQNIRQLIDLGIPHISAYSLTVEKNTALDVFIRRGQAVAVDEEQAARQFDILVEITHMHGYHHYEISNFGLEGCFSKHNMSYWSGASYLGLGPSAHSFKPGIRSWNIANTSEYINQILNNNTIPSQQENLTVEQQFNEYIMTSLRTMWGIEKDLIQQKYGSQKLKKLLKGAQKYITNQKLTETTSHIKLTDKGKFFADGIAADLFEIG
jgi:oxygen-independent coproporphyrinogen III oxidase